MHSFLVNLSQNHMATTFDFRVNAPEASVRLAERVLRSAHELVSKLENEWSEYHPESPVYLLNQSDPHTKIQAPDSLFDLLEKSNALFLRTGGAFDPTFRSGYRTESLEEKIIWNRDEKWVEKTDPRVKLGFGAIGKGAALDQVRLLLEREGFTDFCLNAGGSSIILSGYESIGKPWRIAWSWKKDQDGSYFGQEFHHITAQAVAIGISGSLEQGEHIVGASHALLSAWVSSASATDADALSTALYSLGWEEGYEQIVDPLERLSIAAIAADETPYWNGHFQKNFGAPRIREERSHPTYQEMQTS